jgi:hypothetical protein
MRIPVTAWIVIAAAVAPGQTKPDDSAGTRPGLEAVRPAMARLRAGEVDVELVRVVVTEVLAGPHAIAAPWWLATAPDAGPDNKLLPSERETLAKLRRATERTDTFPEERKVTLRLIRHVESLIAAKEHAAARRGAAAARAFLALVPDAGLTKLLEAAEKKIPPPGDDPAVVKEASWPAGLQAEAAAAWRGLIAQALAAYAEAGCKPGRHVLARAIRNAAALVPEREIAASLKSLRALVRSVEPKAALTLFVRTIGTARFLLDGEPLAFGEGDAPFEADKHDVVEVAVVPGDLVTISFKEPYASDEITRSFVVAFHGRFEGRDLAAKDLFCDLGETPGGRNAVLLPAPLARKKSDPPTSLFGQSREQDDALRATNTYFELPKTVRRSVDVPCFPDMIAFLQEFETRKLAPLLIGTETDAFALVIRVPDA